MIYIVAATNTKYYFCLQRDSGVLLLACVIGEAYSTFGGSVMLFSSSRACILVSCFSSSVWTVSAPGRFLIYIMIFTIITYNRIWVEHGQNMRKIWIEHRCTTTIILFLLPCELSEDRA